MEKINIIKRTHYRDGGTLSFTDDKGIEYCRDHRFEKDPNRPGYVKNVSTVGMWFLGYPNEDNSNIISNLNIIMQLEQFAKDYPKILIKIIK